VIPDIAEAISCVRVADDLARVEGILDLVPSVPPLVWGRDERHTGDMWNSNSVVSCLLARAGIEGREDLATAARPRSRMACWHHGRRP